MSYVQPNFNKRVSALGRKHEAMTFGYKAFMRHDGLIVVKPRRRVFWGYPFKMLLALFIGFFVFKGLMLASLGDITYNERVAKLHQGSAIERGGAWVMQIDPATKFFSGFIAPFIR